ncbi:GNAT family N-acetyltransferase [Solwaraspora sp. WMMD406]|uniref:GNAT family N-acetyltransferase n=1 Tax=Solwaraspora sp. WMMD406 TaxID=3016095 RepID=UPI002417AA7C|nr:GNAT family N-acetyltransferase [Solwaraspora sp. WMMD406]MDG4766982.1 GNAT family N-acetyltransferase [Solwaraspora sp. WMMD406]
MPSATEVTCHVAAITDLDPVTLYQLLRLRTDVFVVEQRCPYPELDGRDLEPGARHLWLARGADVVAYLRLLDDGERQRVGRVVVAAGERGHGYAGRLMAEALALVGQRPCVLAAQSHLASFYRRYGFVVAGPPFVEDGIDHVPMHRPGRTS